VKGVGGGGVGLMFMCVGGYLCVCAFVCAYVRVYVRAFVVTVKEGAQLIGVECELLIQYAHLFPPRTRPVTLSLCLPLLSLPLLLLHLSFYTHSCKADDGAECKIALNCPVTPGGARLVVVLGVGNPLPPLPPE
jgi:hypothetical protein